MLTTIDAAHHTLNGAYVRVSNAALHIESETLPKQVTFTATFIVTNCMTNLRMTLICNNIKYDT